MPRSAGMHKSGVRMVREKAMDGFFNNLLVPFFHVNDT
jgi:hypothetical protein